MDKKFTTGKWFPSHMGVNYTTYHNNMTKIWHPMGDEEQRANALLISKAPEMLQMLEQAKQVLMDAGFEVEQLIKQATEL